MAAFLLEQLKLLFAKFLLIELSALVDVLLTVLQHAVDQSGEPMSHGRDRLRRSQFGSQAAVLRAQVTLASDQGGGGQPQCRSGTVDYVPRASASTLSPLMRLSGHSPNHEAKCASVFQRLMSNPTSLMTVCATITLTPSIRVRSTPLIRCNSLLRLKPGAFPWIRFAFFGVGYLWLLRRCQLGSSSQRCRKLLQMCLPVPDRIRRSCADRCRTSPFPASAQTTVRSRQFPSRLLAISSRLA